ncbi:MAG: cation:proton antiporter [Planktothrix sp.]|uniref:cation:proton antiporter domain-containing protein n=1 Tax=Planktothrix sp. TaxID=3088171 RepID=UPI0038D40BED
MSQFLDWLPDSPIVAFTILLLVSLAIPPWFERLRLPGLVGLLIAGVVLGPNGLQLLDPSSETMKLFSDIGKVYLLFVAGLEIDLEQFHKNKHRSLGFGLSTFLVPLMVGMFLGFAFGFGPNAAILIGSILSSHTPIGYPIIQRLGLVEAESVVVTIGATVFTDISALFVLAICVSIHAGEFSVYGLIWQLSLLAIYSAIVLLGFSRLGKIYFRRTGDDESNQFLFVLLVLFVASVGAQIIKVDMIVGAFLAGLAINEVVGNSPVKEKVEFLGSVLFIPFFFVAMGLLLNIPVFIATLINSFELTLAIVLGLIGSKFIAAWIAKKLYRYNWNETMVMWSLSLPQVAATLAATLVGLQVGLLTEAVFNSVIVMMVVTSTLGPLLTQRFAPKLRLITPLLDTPEPLLWWENRPEFSLPELNPPFRIVVPVYNPKTERYLMEMAALIARHESGGIIPLSVATQAQIHLDEPELQLALRNSRILLNQALKVGQEFNIETKPELRIDNDVATGIIRTACEQNASLIIMGWSQNTRLRARLFGTVIDSVFWSSHCPVAVMKLLQEPIAIKTILIPVKTLTVQTIRTVRFAQLLADTNQAQITVLHVCPSQAQPEQIALIHREIDHVLHRTGPQVQSDIKIIASDEVSSLILSETQHVDLIILRSQRRRTAGGLEVSSVTSEVIHQLPCSMILFGEPHS